MNDELIKAIWKQGKAGDPRMSAQEIESILARSARTGWSELRRMVWFYLGLMGVGVMMIAWDCATYRANPVWVSVMGGMSLLLVGFIAFGLRVLHDMHQLDDTMDSVAGLVQRQLHFFRTRYQFWLAMVAAGIWVLSFAVSLQMYHDAGQYRVTVDGFLMVFSVLQAVIIYGLVRGSHHLFSRRLVAALEDLNAQATEKTDRIERGHRGLKVLLVVAVVAGILLFAGVLLRFLHP